jgi:hypothetical protein
MDVLLLVIILLLVFGIPGGYWYTGRPGYAGPDRFSLVSIVVAVVVIVLVVRLLGIL